MKACGRRRTRVEALHRSARRATGRGRGQRRDIMATQLAERSQTTRDKLSGIWSPVLTPVDADLNPHAGRFVAHARWLLDNGCHGLVIFGTTGEANSFSVDERIALLDAAISAGLPRERLLVGTGCCALT